MTLIKDLRKSTDKYQVILVDPPWNYRGQVQHGGKDVGYTSGANAFYPTLTIDDLCGMGDAIKNITDPEGTCLYLWYTPPILEDAMRLVKEWGFKYKTIAFVWDKQRVNPGHYTMSRTEMVLVGTKTRVPQPRGARNVQQFLSTPRTSHSTKPLEIRERINEMHPLQKKIELFSRFDQKKVTNNWDDWGKDLGSVPWVP
jgi:N6-adenosine-specific RNA methylase IME4